MSGRSSELAARNNAPDEPPLRRCVDLKTLAATNRLPESTLRQWIREGVLPAH